jgi:hypothetical protein
MKERSMNRVLQNERGMALAVAIFAIVVVGALVAGAFFAGTQEQRVGENVRRGQQAFGVTEGGALEYIRAWKPESINTKRAFPLDTLHHPRRLASGGSGYYGGDVYKLNANLYVVDVTGADKVGEYGASRADAGARQRIGMLVRVRPVQFDIRASLTTQGAVKPSGQAEVDGNIHVPPNWTECGDIVDTAKAGLRTPDPSQVTGAQGHAFGSPGVLADPSVNSNTFNQFGDETFATLAARATITLPPGNYTTQPSYNADGSCNIGDLQNWGDGVNRNPASRCATRYPIIHITGNVTLNNVQGQGILLVDGDMTVQGSYEFFGVVVVRGALKTAGGGTTDAHFWGAVMAQNVELDTQNMSGKATLNYSKCAILQSLQNTGLVSMMRSRGWVQLF